MSKEVFVPSPEIVEKCRALGRKMTASQRRATLELHEKQVAILGWAMAPQLFDRTPTWEEVQMVYGTYLSTFYALWPDEDGEPTITINTETKEF